MKRFFAVLISVVFSVISLMAQDEILVMGKVISTVEDEPLSGVQIFVFKTVGAGKYEYDRAKIMYEDGYVPEGAFREERSMTDGTFEFNAQPGGALLFYQFPFKPEFVKIGGKNKIPTVKIEATTVLDEATLTEEGKKKTKKGKPVAHGNSFKIREYYYFDDSKMGNVKGLGKEIARMVTQVYVVNSDGSDTLQFFPPRVYDGEHFHQTQYHWNKDYLYDVAETSHKLQSKLDTVELRAEFALDDPTALYYCKANVWIEDYLNVYYKDSVTIFNTGRVSRPFQFLEYSFDQNQVDPQKYYKAPKRENVSVPKNMKLQFLIGKAELDKSDAATMASLDSLKEELIAICEDPASTLTELHFQGFSSPDGQYAKNKDLSERRTQTVFNEVWSAVPRNWRDRVFKTAKGEVASWSDVADLLEADSLKTEAAAVREVVSSSDNMDVQGAKMKRLPFYEKKVKPVLPELRSVKCNHMAQVYRFLTEEEILHKYNTDEAYRKGTKHLTLNEYWNLFNLVKDEKELEDLYKRGIIAAIRAEGKKNPWALPANHLAVTYLKRKQVDTTLLAPFINEKWGVNFTLTEMSGDKKLINDDAIVANQVQMFMLAKNYERAEELSSIIENEHPMLRAIVRCLGGYIDYSDPKEQATVELIKKSSVRNEVIVNFYLAQFDSTTVKALQRLPQEQALTDYLKAQRFCLQYDNEIMAMNTASFDRSEDPSFSHPKDEIIPAATPEEIKAVKDEIQVLKEDIDLYRSMGLSEDVAKLEKELETKSTTLASMEKGEISVIPYECNVYEAAYAYLKRCFERDGKFVKTAQADYDIAEDLLNDVLGIKKEKKKL